jgi:hypothetical protein
MSANTAASFHHRTGPCEAVLEPLEKALRYLPSNCTVAFTGRSDRRIIGSQVNLMELSQNYLHGMTLEDISRAEHDLNVTPMGIGANIHE